MNTPEEAQAIINQVKAESYDQISGLNRQVANLSAQLNQQNLMLQRIVGIVSPDNQDLTVEELLAKLEVAFKPKGRKRKEEK